MKHLTPQIVTGCLIMIILFGCNRSYQISDILKSKQDSLEFVKSIIDIYPEAQGPKIADFGKRQTNRKKFDPIDFETLKRYAENYTNNPLIKNKNGFMIDLNGMDILRNHGNYKQVFLRFGKFTNDPKVSDDYTIMILPLDNDLRIIHRGAISMDPGSNNNYDYLDPCPVVCPEPDILP